MSKIESNHRVGYWKTLKKYGLYSLECRHEQYSVIYTILENLVSNIETNRVILAHNNPRLGRTCHLINNVLNSRPKARKDIPKHVN